MAAEDYYIDEKQEDKNLLDNIDFNKLLLVIRKNLPWILIIMVLANIGAYLYLRYTKPVYQSNSIIKLDIKSEASILGLGMGGSQNLNNLSGEIELLRSNLFFNKVVNAMDIDVSYHAYGRVLDQERYKNSPFRIEHKIYNERFYDYPIDIEILNSEQFVMSYQDNGTLFSRAYRFGDKIQTQNYDFIVYLTDFYNSELNNTKYYFTINSTLSLISYLQQNMEAEPVNFNANTIRVSFKGHDQKKVKDMVMAIDSVYLNYTQEKKNQATEQQIAFLNKQLSLTEQRLEKYENYFENFTINNKTTDLESEIGKTITMMSEVDKKNFEIQTRLSALKNINQQIMNEDSVMFDEPSLILEFPQEIKGYISELNNHIEQRKRLSLSYKADAFASKIKNQRIQDLKNNILSLLEKYEKKLQLQSKELEKEKKEIEVTFVQLPSKSTEFSENERYYSLYENVFLSLMQKKNELEIAKAGTVTDFVVLAPANFPLQPIAPANFTVHGIGAAIGFVLSFVFVAIGYLLNNKISSQQELERYTSVPVLGTIPFYRNGKGNDVKLVVNQSPKSSISESFRSVRTSMQFMGAKKDKKIISVTSTIGSEGKTFIATNLGNVMALSNQKVVILDVDLRKPKVHHVFSQENSVRGVSTILIGEYDLEECIIDTEVDGLDFIPAGPIPPNPSELIISEKFDELLAQLKEKYDVIIIDTPPIGLVTDGMLVMEKADLPIYVMRSEYSKKLFVKTLNKILFTKKFKSISVILNAVNTSLDRGYGYGKYGFGYYEESIEETYSFSDKVKQFFGRDS